MPQRRLAHAPQACQVSISIQALVRGRSRVRVRLAAVVAARSGRCPRGPSSGSIATTRPARLTWRYQSSRRARSATRAGRGGGSRGARGCRPCSRAPARPPTGTRWRRCAARRRASASRSRPGWARAAAPGARRGAAASAWPSVLSAGVAAAVVGAPGLRLEAQQDRRPAAAGAPRAARRPARRRRRGGTGACCPGSGGRRGCRGRARSRRTGPWRVRPPRLAERVDVGAVAQMAGRRAR